MSKLAGRASTCDPDLETPLGAKVLRRRTCRRKFRRGFVKFVCRSYSSTNSNFIRMVRMILSLTIRDEGSEIEYRKESMGEDEPCGGLFRAKKNRL